MVRNHRLAAFATACLAFAIAPGLDPSRANAEPAAADGATPPAAHSAAKPVAASKPYYIEFRSRSAQSYGHTFSIYGRLNAQGKIATKTVAGLSPFSESAVPWMVGHLILVPSDTGATDGDTEDQYVTARFRVALTAEEYRKVTGYIKGLQSSSPVWHALLYNCNAFVGDIAQFMGLDTPMSSVLLKPASYITSLRDLNISKPKTAAMIGTPVRVEDADKLRAQALKATEQQEKRTATGHRAPTEGQSHARSPAPAAAGTAPAAERKTAPRSGPVSSDTSKKSAPKAEATTSPSRPDVSAQIL